MNLQESVNCVVNGLYTNHWKSVIIACDLPNVRKDLENLVRAAISLPHYSRNQIVDLVKLFPDPKLPENWQLDIWKQTIRGAPFTRGYLVILDSKDLIAKWSEETRHKAWKFLSRVAFCSGVIVLSGVAPKSTDDYRRVADLEEMGDPFDRIPYFLPSLNSGDELERLKVVTLGD